MEAIFITNRKLNWKHVSYVVLGLITCCIIGGGVYHNSNKNTSRNIATTKTIPTKHHSKMLNYNNKLSKYSFYMNQLALKNHASASLVMNAKNGKIYSHKNIHQKRAVASVAKLMTLYLVQKKANRLHAWNKPVHINSNVRNLSNDVKDGLGGFEFKKNHTYTVHQLYEAAVIGSSNNAAIALGEWTAGSNSRFIKLMNKQAHLWHLSAHFVSASGLENVDLNKFHLNITKDKKGANKLSALDVAVITRHLLHDYPQITKLSRKPQIIIDGQLLHNVNGLLKGRPFYNKHLHVIGLKSGYTQEAGYNFVAYATPHHKSPIIAIVLNDNLPNEWRDLQSMLKKTEQSETSNSNSMM